MTVLPASFGQMLLWCAIQLAAVTSIAVLLARIVGRRNPAAGVWCLRAGLVAVIGVTLLAAAPLPSWFGLRAEAGNRAEASGGGRTATSDAPGGSVKTSLSTADGESVAAAQFDSLWDTFDAVLTRAATMPEPQAEATDTLQATDSNSLMPVVLWLAAGLVTLGGLWFLVGLIAVRRLLAGGEVVTDARVTETLDVVLAQLSCTRRVRVIETERVASPATIGFFRPVILLPSTWYDFSDEELHVVLAHEAAHVRANDFAATVLSQLVVAIHFFHPFAHFLSRQLRLTQELAADATASAVAAGRTEYASVLAGMALQTNSQRNLWATQAFLPAPRTMLRRIEMLRDSKELRTHVGRSGRAATSLVIAAVTCAVVGLRANPTSLAEEPEGVATRAPATAPTAQRESQPLSLDWVPNGSLAIVAVKPNELMSHAAFQPLQEAVSSLINRVGLDSKELDSISVCWTHPEISRKRDPRKPVMAFGTFAVIRSRSKQNFEPLRKELKTEQETVVNGTTVYVNPVRMACFMPDEYTVVTGQTEVILEIVRTGKDGTTNRFWLKQWDLVKSQPAAALVDLGAIRDSAPQSRGPVGFGGGAPGGGMSGYPGAGGGMAGGGGDMAGGGGYPGGGGGAGLNDGGGGFGGFEGVTGGGAGGLASGGRGVGAGRRRAGGFEAIMSLSRLRAQAGPILAYAELLTAAVDVNNGVRINAVVTTVDAEESKTVLEAMGQTATETQRLLRRQQHSIARSRDRGVALFADLMNIGESALKSVKAKQTNDGVGVSVEIPADQLQQTLARLAPAMKAVSDAQQQGSSEMVNRQNLKTIMLAMLNYHDAHGQFPPSVTLGKNGVPVSWRVLITPFIARQDIFEKYRFDEPWNSEHNAKVTANMPSVFRHPLSDSWTSTCYFGVVSSDAKQPTVFGPSVVQLHNIADGTSNTIAVVEAKRSVHWAKPEDLKFTPGGKLPPFGGFTANTFSAARADGSVATYGQSDLKAIRDMLTIRDGKVVEDPARDEFVRD